MRSQQWRRRAVAETAATDAAVAQTANQVVTYAGKPIVAYYFASSRAARPRMSRNSFAGARPSWSPTCQGVAGPVRRQRASARITMTLEGCRPRRSFEASSRVAARRIVVSRAAASRRVMIAELSAELGTTSAEVALTAENALDLTVSRARFTITPQWAPEKRLG